MWSTQVRTKLAGDLQIGDCVTYWAKENWVTVPPSILIHEAPHHRPINTLGAYSERPGLPRTGKFEAPPSSQFPRPNLGFYHLAHSWAPLENVTRVRVFKAAATGHFRAILLDYENGAQRALGDCRLGVDPVVAHANPSRVCFAWKESSPPAGNAGDRRRRRRPKGVFVVESGSESQHSHGEDGWICSPMMGVLHVWSWARGAKISLEEGPPPSWQLGDLSVD